MAKEAQSDIERAAIEIVKAERTAYESAVCFVTDKVAFNMRNLIRQLRRNYWGIFQEPKDPNTGRDKIWFPLTESTVEAVVKNIDLDTKDINLRAKTPDAVGMTAIARSILKTKLDTLSDEGTSFGEELDMLERNLCIDGTAVWKTYTVGSKTYIRPVDLLNVYIEPTARSIQDAYRFTERSVMTIDEIHGMDGWINTDDVQPVKGLARVDEQFKTIDTSGSTASLVDVWELWGKIPKYIITNNVKDKEVDVDGHVVVSGLDKGGTPRVHLIEVNTKKDSAGNAIKPYEEAWYTRVSNRWYGKGIAEKVMIMQLYLNIIGNIRVTRSLVSQLGIFKIRKGSGVTPQMISRLASNGAVVVNQLDDIEQFVMQEASQASYKDEETAVSWSERLTSAFEAATGERLPSSTPATLGMIQQNSAQSAFTLIKEGLGMFLKRWLQRQYIPQMMKTVKSGDIIRIIGESSEIKDASEKIANKMVYDRLSQMTAAGIVVDPAQVEAERQRVIMSLNAQTEKFVELMQKPDMLDYEVAIDITNEEVDKGVLAQNLLTALQLAPEYKDIILGQIFDLMGLDTAKLSQRNMAIPQQPQGANQGGGMPMPQGQPIQGQPMPPSDMMSPPMQPKSQDPMNLVQQANLPA